MDIIYFIKALLKKKWWIIISSLVAVAGAFAFTAIKPRLYVSNTQISTGFTINDQIKLRDENNNLFEADIKFNNVIETFNSPVVIGMLSYNLFLHDLTENKPFTTLDDKDRSKDEYKELNKEAAIRICRQKLDSLEVLSSYNSQERNILECLKLYKYDYESIREKLNVARMQRTDYLEIVFRSHNPELSAYAVNTLYQQFIRYNSSLRSERSVESIESFNELVTKKKTELDEKIEELRKYKAAEGLLNVDVASGNQLDLIKQFEKSLSDEKTSRNTINASMESVDAQLALIKKGRTVYDNSNAEIIETRKQIADLNDQYTAKGSNDDAMKSKIASLRNQLQSLLANSKSSSTVTLEQLQQQKVNLTAQLNASDMNIKALENRIASLKGTVGSYATKEATVGTLKHEVDMAQDEYNKLKEKLTAAQDNQTAASNNFKQTLKGQPSYKPESSKRLIIMGMAGVSVAFLSAFLILLMEFLDHSLKSPAVFGRHIDLKLISSINHADLQKHSILEVLKHSTKNGEEKETRQNTFRELVRKLRYEVEHSDKQVLLLTSTESQQGKTTLAQALAYSLSLSNKKVLVIDTNFCNNDLTVQMEAEPTLESFSVAPEDLTIEKVKAIVTTYPLSGIEVIGCKGGDYTPSEILLPNNILQHFDFLKKHYDFIIMEGAPLNEFTDSKELVKYVDGVIAIFSSKVALTQSDKDSIEFLQGLNGKLIGAVLNNVQEVYLEI